MPEEVYLEVGGPRASLAALERREEPHLAAGNTTVVVAAVAAWDLGRRGLQGSQVV